MILRVSRTVSTSLDSRIYPLLSHAFSRIWNRVGKTDSILFQVLGMPANKVIIWPDTGGRSMMSELVEIRLSAIRGT
jgi:hypothetical protein